MTGTILQGYEMTSAPARRPAMWAVLVLAALLAVGSPSHTGTAPDTAAPAAAGATAAAAAAAGERGDTEWPSMQTQPPARIAAAPIGARGDHDPGSPHAVLPSTVAAPLPALQSWVADHPEAAPASAPVRGPFGRGPPPESMRFV